MNDDMAIEASGLAKSYRDVRVLDGVDLSIPRGSVFALLGPNGAGKTTTVRIVATLTGADAGRAWVAGFDVRRERSAVRRRISLTGQFAALDDTQTGEENLRMMARLARLSRAQARQRAAELLEVFELTAAGRRRVGTYSGGMRRRLDLTCSGPQATAVLAGHVTASLLRNIASTALVTAVAFGLGFRPHGSAASFAAALGLLMLFVAAVSWLAAAFGLLVRAPEAAGSAMFF